MYMSSPLDFSTLRHFLHDIIRHRGYEHRLWSLDFLGVNPGFLLASCVTLGKLLNLSVPHILHLQNESYRADVRLKGSSC